MTAAIEEGKLTAWERWELAEFDGPTSRLANPRPAGEQAPQAAVVLPTAADVERIHEEAHRQGYQAGYEEGQLKARGEAERLGRAAIQLEDALAGLESGVADELLALALELARQVVRREIHAYPESLLDVVREALAQLPHQHAAIYLHPEDASLVRSYLGEQLTHAGHRIHEDDQLKRGDCKLEASGGHLDASVATRWQRVLDGLGMESAWQETPTS